VLDPQPKERVLILGQGPVGQLAGRIACERGAWVAATDLNEERLKRAVGDVVFNAEQEDLAEVITEPVDAIIEASGSMQALANALPLLNKGGTILLLGYYQQLDIPYMPLFLKEARLLTAKEWAPGDLQRSRDLIVAGKLEVESLVTHNLPIGEVEQGYNIALNNPDCLKLVLHWL